MKESRFDLDLKFGQQGEQWLTLLADERKIEVKRERDIWKTTGNICFEFRCSGKPSGIAVTQADYWAHILCFEGKQESVLLFRTELLRGRLREMMKRKELKIVNGGDGERAEIILYPLTMINKLLT